MKISRLDLCHREHSQNAWRSLPLRFVIASSVAAWRSPIHKNVETWLLTLSFVTAQQTAADHFAALVMTNEQVSSRAFTECVATSRLICHCEQRSCAAISFPIFCHCEPRKAWCGNLPLIRMHKLDDLLLQLILHSKQQEITSLRS